MSSPFLSIPPEIHIEIASYLPPISNYNLSLIHPSPSTQIYAIAFIQKFVKELTERVLKETKQRQLEGRYYLREHYGRSASYFKNAPWARTPIRYTVEDGRVGLTLDEKTCIAKAASVYSMPVLGAALGMVVEKLISLMYQREKFEQGQKEADAKLTVKRADGYYPPWVRLAKTHMPPPGPAGQTLLVLLHCLLFTVTATQGNTEVSMPVIRRIGAAFGKDLNEHVHGSISMTVSQMIVLLNAKRRPGAGLNFRDSHWNLGDLFESEKEMRIAEDRLFECYSSLIDSGLDINVTCPTTEHGGFLPDKIAYTQDGKRNLERGFFQVHGAYFRSALIYACYYRNVRLFQFLLEKGARIDQNIPAVPISPRSRGDFRDLVIAAASFHDSLDNLVASSMYGQSYITSFDSNCEKVRQFTTQTVEFLTYLATIEDFPPIKEPTFYSFILSQGPTFPRAFPEIISLRAEYFEAVSPVLSTLFSKNSTPRLRR